MFPEVCPGQLARRPQERGPDGCRVLSARLRGLASPQPFPQRGNRPAGGALESEEMGPFRPKLLLFSHPQHSYAWSQRLRDYLRPNHICLMEINNQSCIAVDSVQTVIGMGLNNFSFGVGFLLESWQTDVLCSFEHRKALLWVFCTQSKMQSGQTVFCKSLRVNYRFTDIPVFSHSSNVAQAP